MKKLENGTWVPMIKLVFLSNTTPPIGKRFIVTECDTKSHVPKDQFVLNFADPVHVRDFSTNSFVDKVTEFRLADRRRLKSQPFNVVALSPQSVEAISTLPNEIEPRVWPKVLIGAFLAVGSGALLLMVKPLIGKRGRITKSDEGRIS